MGWHLVKISASGPMPTSRYWLHTPREISVALTCIAASEPGTSWLRSVPIRPRMSLRRLSDFALSPRACSSMTRSSSDTTKVTPAAFTACKSMGESSDGADASALPAHEFERMAASLPIGFPGAAAT